MPRHRLREIAALSGVSEATVDRVIHQRGTTRPDSVTAVRAAIVELDRRLASVEPDVDELVIEAVVTDDPSHLGTVREALSDVRPRLRPQIVRTSVETVPGRDPDLAATALARVGARRPHGVLVDLADDVAVLEQAELLMRAGIPVITMRAAFSRSASSGHSGLDNRASGATAAHLVAASSDARAFAVACPEPATRAEQDRVAGFVDTLRDLHPGAAVTSFAVGDAAGVDLTGYGGLYVANDRAGTTTVPRLREQLGPHAVVVGHRYPDMIPQLATHVFDFALDVDWRVVVREGCRAILEHHRRGPGRVVVAATPPVVLTPFNLER